MFMIKLIKHEGFHVLVHTNNGKIVHRKFKSLAGAKDYIAKYTDRYVEVNNLD